MRQYKGTVIIGGTESDTHVVSIYLAAFMLEEYGYHVINRSCQNATADLMAAAEEGEDILAYVVCNQNGHALEDLRDLRLCKPASTPVILGGHYTIGCHKKLTQQCHLRAVGVDMFVETLSELIPLLNQIAVARGVTSDWSTCLTETRCHLPELGCR